MTRMIPLLWWIEELYIYDQDDPLALVDRGVIYIYDQDDPLALVDRGVMYI